MKATKVEVAPASTLAGLSDRIDAMAAALGVLTTAVQGLVDAVTEDEEPEADPFQSLDDRGPQIDEHYIPDRGSSLDG